MLGLLFVYFTLWQAVEWNLASLPVDEHYLGCNVKVRLSSFPQFTHLDCQKFQEFFSISPLAYSIFLFDCYFLLN